MEAPFNFSLNVPSHPPPPWPKETITLVWADDLTQWMSETIHDSIDSQLLHQNYGVLLDEPFHLSLNVPPPPPFCKKKQQNFLLTDPKLVRVTRGCLYRLDICCISSGGRGLCSDQTQTVRTVEAWVKNSKTSTRYNFDNTRWVISIHIWMKRRPQNSLRCSMILQLLVY